MSQSFSLTRRRRPAASVWAMPTAAFSNVPRKRASLSRSAPSVARRSVMSVQVPNHLKMWPSPSRIVAEGQRPRKVPAEGAVGAAEPELDLVGRAGRDRADPHLPDPGQIFGVDGRPLGPPPGLLRGEARVLDGAGVDVVDRAVR